MSSSASGFGSLINIISGGALSRFTMFAMSISPYITASIVIQLLAMVIPAWERMTKEGGELGRQKLNKYTKYLTVILALVEGLGIYLSYRSYGIFIDDTFLTGATVVLSLITGTCLLMWLGDEITSKGIGNGISVIIFVGIISGLPGTAVTLFNLIFTQAGFSTTGLITALGIIIGAIILIAGVVFVQEAERRVPVQYAKKVVGRKMYGGQNTHIPLKLVMAGVMPIQTGFWAGVYKFSIATSTSNVPVGYTIANALVYLLLIVGFTFFYTYATFNPAEVASNIKKNGGFIPGIRAGKPTSEYLSSIISKIVWFGGFFLSIIAILPMLLRFTSLDISFGGTSILIVVGVALEVVQQLESQLVMRHYKGFLD